MYHGIERRQFFRISDRLRVGYALLAEVSQEEEASLISKNSSCDLAASFDNRLHTLISAARLQDSLIAELADLLNKKLNFVIAHLELDPQTITTTDHNIRAVNISACGIAFANHEPLPVGQKVKMDLMLLPENMYIHIVASVVACEESADAEVKDDEKYYLRFNFDRIHSDDQELLIQHTVKRQAFMLKTQREAEAENKPEE